MAKLHKIVSTAKKINYLRLRMTNESEYLCEQGLFRGHIPHVMGTRLDFITWGVSEAHISPLWEKVCNVTAELDSIFNRFSPQSEVWAFNNWKKDIPFRCSEKFRMLVGEALSFWNDTEGLFDITKGRMLELQVDGDILQKSDDDVRLDFGGIAKGYALRKIEMMLKDAPVESAFVNFGNSSILAVGHHPYGDCWKVSLPSPFDGKSLREYRLRDRSLSISGNTPGYSGHIIHPLSGDAVTDRRVTSVVGGNPLEAEVLSTVMMLADMGQRKRILGRFPNAEAEIIDIC